MASANNMVGRSHEEYRRQKELEEARKAGLAPAAVDEEGKEINPHIPQYMSSAPWYLNNNQPSLKHQKDWRQQAKDDFGKVYDRGVKVFQAKKYRKGACENCGAMTHAAKDCMERPRAKGAKLTNKFIAADEKVQDLRLETYEARRDRWNGYDTAEYARVFDRYEALDAAKTELRKKAELARKFRKGGGGEGAGKGRSGGEGGDSDGGSEGEAEDEDEDKLQDAEEAGFGKVEKRVRTTAGGASGSVRNLRIREDTAKYLLNLDANSAHYDPKSRSMREDPEPYKPEAQKAFLGDNFVRKSGDYYDWQRLTVHAFAAHDKGQDIHMQASPSQAEALFQQYRVKKDALAGRTKAGVLDRYGDAAAALPGGEEGRALLLGQTEAYVEYDAQGRVIKGEAAVARSKYEEDVFPNNHTTVWGSWWRDGTWGFACCHSTMRNSYCTGAAGHAAAEVALAAMEANLEAKAAELEASREAAAAAAATSKPAEGNTWGSEVGEEVQLDRERLREAIAREEALQESQVETDERKRAYGGAGQGADLTEEEMEAYRLKRRRMEDPLAEVAAGGKGQGGYEYV